MSFDLVLRGGAVADGTGAPLRAADVAVAGDSLTLLAPGAPADAAETADVTGAVVAPGFIDVHTHSDIATMLGEGTEALAHAAVRQGVTVEICGNCGSAMFPAPPHPSPAPDREPPVAGGARIFAGFEAFAAAHAAVPRANHLASLAGHGTLRAAVLGHADRAATPGELATMCALLDADLRAGAAGLSTGLIYTPGTYAGTEEVIALAAVAARHGKPYVTHLRDEMSRVEEALEEAVLIARRSGAALHVSHHKTAGKYGWGRTERTLPRLAGLRAAGLDVTCDVYPYTAGSTSLSALLPPWANAGGLYALLRRLADAGQRERMRRAIADGVPGWENTVGNGGWDRISVAGASAHPGLQGRTIAEIAAGRGLDPVDLAAELLIAEAGQVTIISHSMREDDVRRVLADPFTMIGSDGVPKPGLPHPRWAGTFARVLGHYARDLGLMSVETAVHRMTGLAAARFGLIGRGVLADGAHADLVVFDPATVGDRATYAEPLLPPAGVHRVVVAGRTVVRDGAVTGARPGRVLRP
ncbi:N-acyl-D-amino-acid deacylase family protein [Actinomadura scrupuli]|uniref:N-acyl-D-amino-acid deacylase family protein n=1 Tax=Actinomadura scrupuli TaxID=559629 RepID=UPI003D979FB7